MSGTKYWHLRPTKELLSQIEQKRMNGLFDDSGASTLPDEEIVVACQKGDILIVNTRLWWHATSLPPHLKEPSISYARDVYLPILASDAHGEFSDMTNIEGLYASEDMEKDVIILTENDFPECELLRSAEPNCEVVEIDGEMALVSKRAIMMGEWLSVAHSDDEESEEEEGEEGEEGEEEDGEGEEEGEDEEGEEEEEEEEEEE